MSWETNRGASYCRAMASDACRIEAHQAELDNRDRDERLRQSQLSRLMKMAGMPAEPARVTNTSQGQGGDEMSGTHSHQLWRHGDKDCPPPFWHPPMVRGEEQNCTNCGASGSLDVNGQRQICRICMGRGTCRLLQPGCSRRHCCAPAEYLHRCKDKKDITRTAYLCAGHAARIAAEKLATGLEAHRPEQASARFGLVDIQAEEAKERRLDEEWARRQEERSCAQTDYERRPAEVLQLPAGAGVERA